MEYYTFPALENQRTDTGAAILQPVLQFDYSNWHLVNQDVHGTTNALINDQAGYNSIPFDTIYGQVGDSACGFLHRTCYWHIHAQDLNAGTPLDDRTWDSGGPFSIAIGGAVEVKNITQCAQYPFSGVFYHGVWVSTGGQRSTPTWNDTVFSAVSPSCSFGVHTNLDTIILYHNYPPPPPLTVRIQGPDSVKPYTPCLFTAITTGGASPIQYSWIPGGSTPTSSSTDLTLSWQANVMIFVSDSLYQSARANKLVTVTSNARICRSLPVGR